MRTPASRKVNSFAVITMYLAGLFLSAPLLLMVYLGGFTRLYADDYCAVWVIRSMGVLDSLVFWYTTWAGRYTAITLIGLQGLGWTGLARLLPGLLILLWAAFLVWALLPFFSGKRLALPAGLLALAATLSMAPNLFQSLYWQSASVAYTYPLILGTVLSGWLIRAGRSDSRSPSRAALAVFAALIFLNSGFSEVFSAAQVVLIGLAIVFVWFIHDANLRRRLLPWLMAGLAAALLGLLVMFVAPGNQARQAVNTGAPVEPIQIGLRAFKYAFKLGLNFGAIHRWIFLFLAAAGFGLGWLRTETATTAAVGLRSWLRVSALVGGLIAVCFIVTAAATAPTVYALNSDLDPRSQIIPLYFIVLTVMVSAGVLGAQVRKTLAGIHGISLNWAGLVLAIVILLGSGLVSAWSVGRSAAELSAYREQARQWDERAAQLNSAQAAGNLDVEAAGLPSWQGLQDLREDPSFWVNDCMAKSFSLHSITGK